MDNIIRVLTLLVILGMLEITECSHDNGVVKGQKMAIAGDIVICQVTNEFGEVTWEPITEDD
jgi:hypothetical protein